MIPTNAIVKIALREKAKGVTKKPLYRKMEAGREMTGRDALENRADEPLDITC
jgi:hypothetical protein